MTALVDSHAHLQEPEFAADVDAVIERARAAGVETIIVPAVDFATAESAVSLTQRFAGVYATAGYHPHEARSMTDEDLEKVNLYLMLESVVAIGECGLDFYRDLSPRETQLEVFSKMLGLAEVHVKPVVIHCRDAWDAMREVLVPWALHAADNFNGRPLGVLHYFTGTLEDAQRYFALGFTISVHTSITHPKQQGLRDTVAALPLNALVVETDSPYGAPQAHRGKRNEPAFVVEAARQIAELHGVSFETVCEATTANAQRLFRLPVPAAARS